MCKNNLEVFETGLLDRLGEVYERNSEYKLSSQKETELFDTFRQELTEDQKQQLDECITAMCFSSGICEKIAYRQGMRDLVSILFDNVG